MTAQKWEKRVCNLIKGYKPTSNVASFRNEYGDVVRLATAEKKIRSEDAELLMQARDFLEEWASPTPPGPSSAYEQWRKVYDAGKNTVPSGVWESILRRFPVAIPCTVDWDRFILDCSHGGLIDVLLDRRLIDEEDLNRLAQTKPRELFQSVALDVMLERKVLHDVGPLWDECIRGTRRPTGLMVTEKVLILCYSASRGDDANERMVALLIDHAQRREAVLALLFAERMSAFRLCRYLSFGRPMVIGRKASDSLTKIQDLLISWVAQCEAELSKGIRPNSEIASFILALIRLSLLTETAKGAVNPGKLNDETARVTQASLLRALQNVEENPSSDKGDTAFVSLGNEFYRTVQDYLRRLPVGAGTRRDSPERALRFERYLASKRVIEQVLLAMGEIDESGLRGALEVALFNSGVRPLGFVGETVSFDSHAHEAETSGVMPDDPVVITEPGRRLGDGQEGFVLTRAKIRPVSGVDPASTIGEVS